MAANVTTNLSFCRRMETRGDCAKQNDVAAAGFQVLCTVFLDAKHKDNLTS